MGLLFGETNWIFNSSKIHTQLQLFLWIVFLNLVHPRKQPKTEEAYISNHIWNTQFKLLHPNARKSHHIPQAKTAFGKLHN